MLLETLLTELTNEILTRIEGDPLLRARLLPPAPAPEGVTESALDEAFDRLTHQSDFRNHIRAILSDMGIPDEDRVREIAADVVDNATVEVEIDRCSATISS